MVAVAWIFLPTFESGVSGLADDVYALLSGEGIGEVTPGRSECPYTYDARTGRWHDESDDYKMVTFSEASASGC